MDACLTRDSRVASGSPKVSDAINTPFGWIGWSWTCRADQFDNSSTEWRLARTSLGHRTRRAALEAVEISSGDGNDYSTSPVPIDLGSYLAAWAEGESVDFADVAIDRGPASAFRWAVTQACRQIPLGQVVTYGDLARRVNRPAAARAVGRVMATNPLPIIVPCHRVVASGGAMRGFSAAGGIATKERMLRMEQATLG